MWTRVSGVLSKKSTSDQFNFVLSYHPSSHMLSLMLLPDDNSSEYPHLSPPVSLRHCTLTWDVEAPARVLHTACLSLRPQFSSIFWRVFCSQIGSQVSLSSGFHPQYKSQTERKNEEMETALQCMVSQPLIFPILDRELSCLLLLSPAIAGEPSASSSSHHEDSLYLPRIQDQTYSWEPSQPCCSSSTLSY